MKNTCPGGGDHQFIPDRRKSPRRKKDRIIFFMSRRKKMICSTCGKKK
jgi:hypothetical protein